MIDSPVLRRYKGNVSFQHLTTTNKEGSMRIQDYWAKADSLRGCLSHLKTTQSHRRHPPQEDEDALLIDPFIADEDKLLESKALRILSKKTQVFTKAKKYTRTRRAHVDTVTGCSIKASDLLGLNTDLERAMVLGHDMGHVPFGHQGEAWMQKAMGRPDFCHEVFGVVIAQHIERKGWGLNLTHQTLNGMICHSGRMSRFAKTPEAQLLNKTDKAYLFHDYNDITKPKRGDYEVSPEVTDLMNAFGSTQRERTNTLIAGIVIESAEMKKVSFEHSEPARKFKKLRDLMYEVYVCVTQQNVEANMGPALAHLKEIKRGDPFLLLALMTDDDVIHLAETPHRDATAFNETSVSEIAPYLRDVKMDIMMEPDLDW